MFAIETDKLTKVYKNNVKALNEVSINVEKGRFYGLLGPNGAGKTTLVKSLLGITKITEGGAKILGQDVSNYKIKKRIGYLPENHRFPQFLNGRQVLEFFGGFSDMPKPEMKKRIEYLLDLTKMTEAANSRIKTYSKGMIQRIGIAQALVNDPEILFLDEPTDGVDPVGRREIRDLLLSLRDQGKTMFLNSHLLSEVELIADKVAIIDKGKIIKEGTVEELTSCDKQYTISYSGELTDEFFGNNEINENLVKRNSGSFTANLEDLNDLNLIIDKVRSAGILIETIESRKITLEDSFMNLLQDKKGGLR